jgi:histidyl-tRNA synthetase
MLTPERRGAMYKAPRGTADILPQEQPYWRFVEEKASALCQLYGYRRIDTPVFEETGLFSRSVGEGTDIVEKEMYTFPDRSGALMTLRPEGTAPVCRAYIEHGMHNLPQPVKLYYFASIFRYERPQAGRYRQHHQFGFEALGEADPALDAEVIDMAWQLYASLGLRNLTLKLNSIGCRECRPGYLEQLKRYYLEGQRILCRECQGRLRRNPLRLLDCKTPSCQEIALAAPRMAEHLCPECDRHFSALQQYLQHLEIPFVVEHRLVRGLDYYTRTVFEIQPEEEGAQSTLGGGGRYDDLIQELGGKPTPALGFATGVERIIRNLKRQGVAVPPLPEPQVYLAYLGEPAKEAAVALGAALRRAGVSVISAVGNKSLKSQLRQANTLGATRVLIIGEEEVRKDMVVLRDMRRGEQQAVPRAEIVKLLQNPQG